MIILHRDYETRSAIDLRKAGAHVYAAHPTTDVWVAVYIVERDGELEAPVIWHPGMAVPIEVNLAEDGWTVAGHNAAFEQAIDREIMGPRYGFPIFPEERIDCTLARAAVQAVPQALDGACKALGVKHQKDMDGHRLMLRMCRPRSVSTDNWGRSSGFIWWDEPAKIQRLTNYCVADVYAEIALGRALRELSPAERDVWLLDQRMKIAECRSILNSCKLPKRSSTRPSGASMRRCIS